MSGLARARPSEVAGPSLREMLELEEIDRDLYRNTTLLQQELGLLQALSNRGV